MVARVQQYYERVSNHIAVPPAGLSSPNSTLFGTVFFQNRKWRKPLKSEIEIISTLNITSPDVFDIEISEGHFNVTGQASSAGSASRVTEYSCNIEIS